MASHQCDALSSPDTYWAFCPSVAADYLFAVLFGLTFLVHIAQAIYYRKLYCWVVVVSALWQLGAFVSRALSILNPMSKGWYMCWNVMLMTGPLWTNAFVYLLLARLLYNFTDSGRLLRIPAWHLSTCFVLLDFLAFAIQAYGIGSAIQPHGATNTVLRGIHIYMAGVGVQETFILIFLILLTSFYRELKAQKKTERTISALHLVYILYAALGLITIRIVFRLVEYSQGIHSTIPNHEIYQYCLDSSPMLVALWLFNCVHPGRVMPGKECDLPCSKESKQSKRDSPKDAECGEIRQLAELDHAVRYVDTTPGTAPLVMNETNFGTDTEGTDRMSPGGHRSVWEIFGKSRKPLGHHF